MADPIARLAKWYLGRKEPLSPYRNFPMLVEINRSALHRMWDGRIS